MGAYTQGEVLTTLKVESAMARKVISCRPEDAVSAAENLMRENQVRRLPVVDAYGKLVGIVSLNDIAVEAERERGAGGKEDITGREIGETLGMICRHRGREVELAA
jgi:CBS domain-containing protein